MRGLGLAVMTSVLLSISKSIYSKVSNIIVLGFSVTLEKDLEIKTPTPPPVFSALGKW